MVAHWVSAKFTGYDGEGRVGIIYEAADLVGGMQYLGIVDGIKGTAMGAVSGSVGSVMLPPEYAGKTITLDLYGGAIIPNVIVDSISVTIPLLPGTPGDFVCSQVVWLTIVGRPPGDVGAGTLTLYNYYSGVRTRYSGMTGPALGRLYLIMHIYSNSTAFEIDYANYGSVRYDSPFGSVQDGYCEPPLELTLTEGVWAEEEPPEIPPPPEECSQELIILFTDDPNRVADVFYTVKGGLPNIAAKSATPFTVQCPANTEVTVNVGITQETIDSFKSFRACTGAVEEIPLQVGAPPPEELITQLIIVRKAGEGQEEYITGATVTVDGKACEGLPDGLYSIDIAEGIEATAEVKAEGYADKTEIFTTTNMATLMIVLDPIVIEGESEQTFTIVDADGNPIEGAAVTVGDKTCITDSNGECTITAPIGEATTATITKPGYEVEEIPITPGAGGNVYPIALNRAEELFSIPGNLKADFDSETVTPGIKTVFDASGIPLSDDATIEKIDDNTWLVKDGEDEYAVVKENGDLTVYPGGGGGGGAPPSPPEVPPEVPPPPEPGEPKWDYVEFDTWVDDSNKARITYKGIDLTPETEYHGVFEVMLPPEVHVGTLINTTSPSGYVDIDATMNEGKTVEIRLYEYASGKPSKIIDRKDVAIPMRPEVDQVEVILGPEMLALWQANPARVVHCDELIDYAWPFLAWFPPMFGLEVTKAVTDGKAIFNAADGLVKGKEYIFHMHPQLALEEVLKGNAVKFAFTPSVTLTKTNIMEEVLCPFFGFEPGSVECENEVNEFVDAYYVANTIKKLATGKNLLGETDTADTFDIIFMPIIMLGAAVPFIPVGKTLKTALGPIINLIRKGNKGAWLAKNQHKMHLLLAAGKGSSLEEAKKLMALGKWDEAERLLDNVVTEIHNSPTLSATARENLAGWNAGARKLLDNNPQMKTKIDDLTDEAVDGTIFKTHFDEFVRHFDEAAMAGDWVKAKQIWIDGVAGSTDNLVYFDMNLAKASPNFQRMHNIMRFSKIDYVNALAEANRLSPDLDFMARHLSEAGEPYNYITVWKALDATEQANVVSNIGQTGRKDLAKIIDLLGADTSKGTKVHSSSAARKLDDVSEMTEDEVRATNNIVGDEADRAAKAATSAETEAAGKMSASDDAVKHPKMARLWAYVHRHPKTAKLMEETGAPSFKKLPIWAKLSVLGVVYMGINSVWKHMMDFCMALFMGEETIQWAGFGGILLNSMSYDWEEKSLSERKEILETFKKFRELRGGIHDTVTNASGVFETLCLIFGKIYSNFWEADKVSLWALDQKIAYMEKGIDPFSGIGECTLLAAADKKGVAFYVHGETQKYYSGSPYDVVHVKDVLVRDEDYKVVLCAEKEGYVLGIQQIRITRDDIGEKISTPTFELIPDSDIGVNPFSGLPYTDEEYNALAQKPTKYGKIICSTNPTGAKIYLDGEYQDVNTNWTLDYVPVGLHKITFKLEGYFDCEKDVNVAIEPHAQAYCILETAEGAIRCERVHNDEYLDRKADILYKKHSDTDWIKWDESAPTTIGGYEDIKGLEVGVEYDVKYNFLEVLECINGKVLTIPPKGVIDCNECQLNSRLPEKVITTVREVIDGDSFRTDFTNGLPKRFYGGELLPQEVRIIGCNCYEIDSPIGQVAKQKLADLIEGKSVTLMIDKNLPLGYHNRVIAGVFYPDDSNHAANDVAGKLIEACVVREYPTKSKQDTYSWEPYSYLDSKWADHTPEMCVRSTDDEGKPLISMIVNTATKTVQMHNRWLPVYAIVRKIKYGEKIGVIDDYMGKVIETNKTTGSYGYGDSTSLTLVVSSEPITPKNLGIEIESIIISDIVDTYPVTFTSSPASANVLVTPKKLALSRLTSVLRLHRDSTPISRLFRRERFK